MGTLLTAHHVTYTIDGHTLLDAVSLELHAGEMVILVGPNGAGKTTLLRLLCGDLEPTDGRITLNGDPLPDLSPRDQARRRAVMRQSTTISFPFTAYEVALMGRHPHLRQRGERAQDQQIACDALAQTDMLAFAARLVPSLSGGEQTRVTLARVLAQQTPVLLLDEPTAALDLRHQHRTMQHARRLADAGGAVLAVVHDLNLAAAYADRIGILSNGHLVALDTPWQALNPALLSEVYDVTVAVQPHPVLEIPLILVLPDPTDAPSSAPYASTATHA